MQEKDVERHVSEGAGHRWSGLVRKSRPRYAGLFASALLLPYLFHESGFAFGQIYPLEDVV